MLNSQPVATGPERPCVRSPSSTPDPHHPRPWHRDSVFGEGPRRPLHADQRRAWLARVELERRTQRWPSSYVDVARALLRHLGVDGRCDPSQATLAVTAGQHLSTVKRALKTLRAAGVLAWDRRLVRRAWPGGGPGATRAEQTSNAYELLLPTGPVTPRMRRLVCPPTLPRLPRCEAQVEPETPSQMIQKGLALPDEASKQQLAAIAAARQARFEAEWLARRAERWRSKG